VGDLVRFYVVALFERKKADGGESLQLLSFRLPKLGKLIVINTFNV
jgi:hypothetical protein